MYGTKCYVSNVLLLKMNQMIHRYINEVIIDGIVLFWRLSVLNVFLCVGRVNLLFAKNTVFIKALKWKQQVSQQMEVTKLANRPSLYNKCSKN